MDALVQTHRLSSGDEVANALDSFTNYRIVISDQTARTLASWYMSPAQRDVALCQLAHGLWFDTEELRSEVERDFGEERDAMIEWITAIEAELGSENV